MLQDLTHFDMFAGARGMQREFCRDLRFMKVFGGREFTMAKFESLARMRPDWTALETCQNWCYDRAQSLQFMFEAAK